MQETRRRILDQYRRGRHGREIARTLGIDVATVAYHTGKLVRERLIAPLRGPRGSPKKYAIAPEALAMLGGGDAPPLAAGGTAPRLHQEVLESSVTGGDGDASPTPIAGPAPSEDHAGRVEVHNHEWKVPYGRRGAIVPDKMSPLHGWTREIVFDYCGVYLEVTTKHVLLRARADGCDSVAEAVGRTTRKLERAYEHLVRVDGWGLGDPVRLEPEWRIGRTKVGVVGHPLVARGAGFERGVVADLDDTPEEGTIHPTDAEEGRRDADRLVGMARNAERTAIAVEQLVGLLTPRAAPVPPDERRDVA